LGCHPPSFPGVSFVRNAPGKKHPGNRAGAASVCRYGHLARVPSKHSERTASSAAPRRAAAPASSHHSIARILPAHPAPGPTIDFAYIAPYAHSIPKSPKRIARNLSNAHCAQYAKQPIARYMHFGQNNIARNAQNAYSAVYAFWPKIHCAVYAFWPKTHCAQSAKPTKNTSQARNMHLFMSTIVIVGPAAAYATFVISCILRAMRT
jgi:hypothetical protein